jgi:hypothetical protein
MKMNVDKYTAIAGRAFKLYSDKERARKVSNMAFFKYAIHPDNLEEYASGFGWGLPLSMREEQTNASPQGR